MTIARARVRRCPGWCMADFAILRTASSSWCRNRLSSATVCCETLRTSRPLADDGACLRCLFGAGQRHRPLPGADPSPQPSRGAVAIKMGLSIYDFLTRKRGNDAVISFRGRRTTLAKWPALNPEIRSVLRPTTMRGSVTPNVLGIELLDDALLAGAGRSEALNYADIRAAGPGQFVVRDLVRRPLRCRRPHTHHQRNRRMDRHYQRHSFLPDGTARQP